MKRFVSIFLLIITLLQVCGKLTVYTCYELNKAYIAKNLCENRNKPQMKCNGKCHLAKELKSEEKREQAPTNALKDNLEILLFSERHEDVLKTPVCRFAIAHSTVYLERLYSTLLFSVYHPPQA